MCNEQHLSSLIGDIHDAALDRSLWVGVLAKIAHFVGGPAAMLLVRSAAGSTVHDYGTYPHYRQLYP